MVTTNLQPIHVRRRTVLSGLGGFAVLGALAGCSTDGGDSADGGGDDTGGSGSAEVDTWLSDTGNYDGIAEHAGESRVTVMVGAEGNGGNFAFEPPAIRVDQGTTVVWEWTGQGSTHNVSDDGGEFESELTGEAGFTFSHRFDERGTFLYACIPHDGLGMRGAVVVE